jgi:hypothetical protein
VKEKDKGGPAQDVDESVKNLCKPPLNLIGRSLRKHNHKLVNSRRPIAQGRHRSFFRGILYRQIDDFHSRIVIGEQTLTPPVKEQFIPFAHEIRHIAGPPQRNEMTSLLSSL